MSCFEQTRQAMGGFDPFAIVPETQYEEWGDLVPAPSVKELVEILAEGGRLDITHEWAMVSAQHTMRHVAAREDTQTMPKIEEDDPDDERGTTAHTGH